MIVTVNRMVLVRLMMIGRVGAVRRAVGRGTVRIRGTDRATGHMSLVEVELAFLFLAQQLVQKPRVVIPDVRRRGGDGASGVAAAVVGAVMVRQKVAYSVHFTRRMCRKQWTLISFVRGNGRTTFAAIINVAKSAKNDVK